MRKVEFSFENEPYEFVKSIGFFHQFGTKSDYNDESGSYFPITVAIVEDEEGQIHSVEPLRLRFLVPL